MNKITFSYLRRGITNRIHDTGYFIKKHLRKRLYKLYIDAYYYQPRRFHAKQDYKKLVEDMKIPKLTRQEVSEIREFWKRFGIKPDINCYRFYYHVTGIHDPRFVPDAIFSTKVQDYFIDPEMAAKTDDKNMYDIYFQERKNFEMPQTIIHKMDGKYLDPQYRYISEDTAINSCLEADSGLVVKKAVDSLGGHGVFIWQPEDDPSELLKTIKKWKDCVVQRIIHQHPFYATINPTSVNTLRIMTALFNEEVVIISSVLRMGEPNSKVDNYSSGGYMCGIDENGRLRKIGYRNNAKQYLGHPNGFVYEGKELPGYDNCLTMVKENAYRLMKASRLVAWDFAIKEDETPILIEINLNLVHVRFNQMANGPMFGERTEEFMNKIILHKS